MEGFLNFRMRPWLRRLITRMVAVVPAALTILSTGEKGAYKLLILSQVILSMQLPFAVIPLIHFTSDRKRMGSFANAGWVRALAWITAIIIVGLNIKLVISVLTEWIASATDYRIFITGFIVPLVIGLLLLLLWVSLEPLLPARWHHGGRGRPALMPADVATRLEPPTYKRIMVPLDHTDRDRTALAHAAALSEDPSEPKSTCFTLKRVLQVRSTDMRRPRRKLRPVSEYLNSIVESLRYRR